MHSPHFVGLCCPLQFAGHLAPAGLLATLTHVVCWWFQSKLFQTWPLFSHCTRKQIAAEMRGRNVVEVEALGIRQWTENREQCEQWRVLLVKWPQTTKKQFYPNFYGIYYKNKNTSKRIKKQEVRESHSTTCGCLRPLYAGENIEECRFVSCGPFHHKAQCGKLPEQIAKRRARPGFYHGQTNTCNELEKVPTQHHIAKILDIIVAALGSNTAWKNMQSSNPLIILWFSVQKPIVIVPVLLVCP